MDPEGSSTRVFISYRHDDVPDATDRLKTALKGHFGEGNVFADLDNLEIGADFAKVIEQYIASCDVLLAVIGRRWLDAQDHDKQRRLDDPDDWVRLEIETALRFEVRVVPVLVYGATMPKKQDLPESLRAIVGRTGVEVPRQWFVQAVEKLISDIEKVASRRPYRPGPPAVRVDQLATRRAPKVFINYRNDDTLAAAILLQHRLSPSFSAENVFLSPSDKSLAELKDHGTSGVFLAVIGPRWLTTLRERLQSETTDYVRNEIEHALGMDALTVVPVLVDDTPPPGTTELPRSLGRLASINMARVRLSSFDDDAQRLIDRIDTIFQHATRA